MRCSETVIVLKVNFCHRRPQLGKLGDVRRKEIELTRGWMSCVIVAAFLDTMRLPMVYALAMQQRRKRELEIQPLSSETEMDESSSTLACNRVERFTALTFLLISPLSYCVGSNVSRLHYGGYLTSYWSKGQYVK